MHCYSLLVTKGRRLVANANIKYPGTRKKMICTKASRNCMDRSNPCLTGDDAWNKVDWSLHANRYIIKHASKAYPARSFIQCSRFITFVSGVGNNFHVFSSILEIIVPIAILYFLCINTKFFPSNSLLLISRISWLLILMVHRWMTLASTHCTCVQELTPGTRLAPLYCIEEPTAPPFWVWKLVDVLPRRRCSDDKCGHGRRWSHAHGPWPRVIRGHGVPCLGRSRRRSLPGWCTQHVIGTHAFDFPRNWWGKRFSLSPCRHCLVHS